MFKYTVVSSFLLLFVFVGISRADFDFGNETYTSADSKGLVVNSLGDKPYLSLYQTPNQSLGSNDFIQESAVKNQLGIDGYTQAWDYNPTAAHPWGVYNQPLPTGVQLHELDFQGLDGDPRTTQKVYVTEAEYQAYSAEAQNQRIQNLANGLTAEGQIRATADAQLQSNINATNSRVDSLDSRVNTLEQVKIIADVNVRLYDAKRYSVGIFDMYDGRHGTNFAVGARITYKLGSSYEERENEALRQKLAHLEAIVSRMQGER
jgi:hypothetical protein